MAATTITLTPFTCGHVTVPRSWMLAGHDGEITVPVTAYLIQHPTAMAVFDTGLGPRCARLVDEIVCGPVDIEEDALINAQLRTIGVDPMSIDLIINSHLHCAHAGANALLPGASVIVQQAEWAYAHTSNDIGYHAPEFDTGQPVIPVTGEHDLFGDGSVVLVPTPGHTPGHQSARVQTAGGEVILAGDACHSRRALDELITPGHGHDLRQYRESLHWFQARRSAGATIAFGHDPQFWASVPQGVPWNPIPS